MSQNDLSYIQPVLLAAGSSTRFGRDKMTVELDGKPLFIHSLLTFMQSLARQPLIICAAGREQELHSLCQKFAPEFTGDIIAGGSERYLSVQKALQHLLKKTPSVELKKVFVAIHDGARPFISAELIQQCSRDALQFGGAIIARPVTDTIKQMKNDGTIFTPERSQLISAETPQIFPLDKLNLAISTLVERKISMTDDASAMELCQNSYKFTLHQGDNRKITFSSDL